MKGNSKVLVAALLIGLTSVALAQSESGSTVDTVAVGHQFQMSTNEVASGWTTFRLDNQGDEVHFLVIERLPEGKTLQDSVTEVVPPFQEAMNLINAGDPEAGFAKLGDLPAWFGEVQFMGGPGLVSPGHVAEVTVDLQPGTYVVECYVKDENGEFHSYHGMIEELTVTDEEATTSEPTAGLEIRLSNDGIEADEEIESGRHVIAIHFDEHQPPPAFGNDVHIVRLEDGQQAEEIAPWMDWAQVQGLRSPAPAEFLGGTHEMPVGNIAYMTVDLEPGRYAYVSELSPEFEMWKEFTVRELD